MLRGDRLKELREARRYTHQELADMIGVGYAQIYRYEAGKIDPNGEVLDRMASVFDVSVDYLLGRTDLIESHSSVELTPKEREAIAAWRRGDVVDAIRTIVGNDQQARNGA